jgi:phosphoglycolate phosphatase
MSKNHFKLLVFDWDGTLMDSQARIVACCQSAIADLDFEERTLTQILSIIGLSLERAFATLFPKGSPSQWTQLVERYRYHFFNTHAQIPAPLFQGVKETLETLQNNGYWLAVATGKSRQGLNKGLTETEMVNIFQTTRCADETRSKPEPQMLQEIMDELGMLPKDTLMIGDSKHDLQMAHNAGIAAVAVSYGVSESAELLKYNPLTCLDNLPALTTWLHS